MLWRLTRFTIRALDRIADRVLGNEGRPEHQRTGRRGEEEAYFRLRELGYVMVARNYRSPRRRGEIDLIGWDGGVLCFVEVKTRTSHDVKPAEAAVNRHKQYELRAVAREYLRRLLSEQNWRFDMASVYFENAAGHVRFELFKNAFPVT